MICQGCGLTLEPRQIACAMCGFRADHTDPVTVELAAHHVYTFQMRLTPDERFILFKIRRILRSHLYGSAFDRFLKRSVQMVVCPTPSNASFCSVCDQRQAFYRITTPCSFPRLFDVLHTRKHRVYLFERPPGFPLQEVMRRGGSPRRVLLQLLQLSRDYELLHHAGFICPTLHSETVVMTSTFDIPRVTDISGLRMFTAHRDRTLVLLGHTRFPEEVTGEYGPWSDVYAFGGLIQELSCWFIPAFRCWCGTAGVNHFFRFVRDCLHPEPQKRIPNMKAWRARLCEILPSSIGCTNS